MAVFSTNQNRQLFVVKQSADTVTETGDIALKGTDPSKTGRVCKEIFFEYMGADTPLRSPLIPVENIEYVKLIEAADLADKLKKVVVKLDEDVHEDGTPISGQDYVLRIAFRQFYGMSDEDQYFKYGVVHATKNMTAKQFYEKMEESLKKNFSRELGTYLEFKGDANGLTITEVEQPWHRGTYAQERVYFEVYPTLIYADGDEVIWGVTQATGQTEDSKGNTVEDCGDGGTIKDGHKIADLEWFCMGERGDQYRMKGWPNVVPTEYLVDPSKEYDALEIHYSFKDSGNSSYKSEKDLTLVAETGGSVLSGFKSQIEALTGIESSSSDSSASDTTTNDTAADSGTTGE